MSYSPIEQAILTCLESGEKTPGELLDYTQCGSYPGLNTALQHLQSEQRIAYHFECGHMTYRLMPKPQTDRPAPFFMAWQRDQPHSRFLWNNPR